MVMSHFKKPLLYLIKLIPKSLIYNCLFMASPENQEKVFLPNKHITEHRNGFTVYRVLKV